MKFCLFRCITPYSMAANKLFFCLHVLKLALFASFSLQNSVVFYACRRGKEG